VLNFTFSDVLGSCSSNVVRYDVVCCILVNSFLGLVVLPLDGSRRLQKSIVLNIGDIGRSPCVSFDDNTDEQSELGVGITQSL